MRKIYACFVLVLVLALSACGPIVTSEKVSFSNPDIADGVLLGGKYTEMDSKDGFILESTNGTGVYVQTQTATAGPYRTVAFRSNAPDLRIQHETVETKVAGPVRGVWKEREIIIFYKDSLEHYYPGTEPIFTETGIIFWTGQTDDPLCEYSSAADYGDRTAWHCVIDLAKGDNGPIAFLYMDGRP